MDFRAAARSNWVTNIDGKLSFYRKGKVHADLEKCPPHHWRLVYYRWNDERFKLQFEFEDFGLPEAAVRLIVEKRVEGMV